LEDIFALLLEDQGLDFLLHFLVGPELFGFFIFQPDEVQPLRAFNHLRDTAGDELRDAPFDRR